MAKKPMNSLFLDHLIKNENFIDENAEKWIQNFSLNNKDIIDEMSEATKEHLVFIKACWGEIGWSLPKWKEKILN